MHKSKLPHIAQCFEDVPCKWVFLHDYNKITEKAPEALVQHVFPHQLLTRY